MYDLKEKIKHELYSANAKEQWSPSDVDMVKKLSESLYYITAACAMEEGIDDYSGRMYPNYSRDSYYGESSGRRRDSMGRYSRDGYSGHDAESKRAFLEEMMADARNESEREMFRKKLDELNRHM